MWHWHQFWHQSCILTAFCMSSLFKRGKSFYLKIYDAARSPKSKRVSLKTPRRREAERRRAELEAAYPDEWDPWRGGWQKAEELSVGEAARRFVARKEQEGRSPHTIRTYSMHLRVLGMGDEKLRDVSHVEIEAWITESHLARASQKARYRHVRAFLRWCKAEGYIDEVPLRMSEPSRARQLPKALSEEQVNLIIETILEDYRDKRERGLIYDEQEIIWIIPAIRLSFYTGMRLSEVCQLQWKDVDGRSITIRKQKRGFAEVIPISSKVSEILYSISKKHRFVIGLSDDRADLSNRLSKRFTYYRKRSGLKKGSFHSLRHGFGTMLARRGARAAEIKRLMRHASIETSMRYVHLDVDDLMGRVDDLIQ